MSWERSKYKAKCLDCGHQGYCIRASDDWNRYKTTWEGFDSEAPNQYEVLRKRASEGDMEPVCKCGSRNIEVGDYVGDCDWKGKLYGEAK